MIQLNEFNCTDETLTEEKFWKLPWCTPCKAERTATRTRGTCPDSVLFNNKMHFFLAWHFSSRWTRSNTGEGSEYTFGNNETWLKAIAADRKLHNKKTAPLWAKLTKMPWFVNLQQVMTDQLSFLKIICFWGRGWMLAVQNLLSSAYCGDHKHHIYLSGAKCQGVKPLKM